MDSAQERTSKLVNMTVARSKSPLVNLTGNPEDHTHEDEAAVIHHYAAIGPPASHSERWFSLERLAGTLEARFEETRELVDLHETILLYRQTLALQQVPNPYPFSLLKRLATALYTRFEETDELGDLDEVVSLHRQALDLQSASDREQLSSLNDLASILYIRFKETGRLVDLDEVISLHRQALSIPSAYHLDRVSSLNDLATALQSRFEERGQLSNLDEAISFLQEVLNLQHAPDPDRPSSLNDLSVYFLTRFELTAQLSNLDHAVSLLREALLLQPPPHPIGLISLNNLAEVLHVRAQQTGQLPDLDEAVSLHQRALTLRPGPHADRPYSLSNLSMTLHTRFNKKAQRVSTDLDDAVSLQRQALDMLPTPHMERPSHLKNLAMILHTRFQLTDQRPDLAEAVSLHREALNELPVDHRQRPAWLLNLAIALHTRFECTGQFPDLDEAVVLLREALVLRPAPHVDHSIYLLNLAAALWTRFEQAGLLPDLDEAVVLLRQVLDLRPAPHPERSSSLVNLAATLQTQFEQTHHISHLDEAVTLLREALTLRPAPHLRRPTVLLNLASALHTRFEQVRQLQVLDEAASLLRESLSVLPVDHVDRSLALNNLANILGTRFQHTHQLSDVEEAITLCRESLQALPPEHPNICPTSTALGHLLTKRFDRTRSLENAEEAMAAFSVAAELESARMSLRFVAARQWVFLSDAVVGRDRSALKAYEAAIGLLPRLATVGLDIGSRQQVLKSNADGLARDAAACAIRFHRFDKAIELLEEGRAIFWSQALQLRSPFSELELVAPGLAQRLKDISRALEQGSHRDISRHLLDSPEKKVPAEREAIRYRQLSNDWAATIEEVRTLDGFQHFLRPKSFAALSAAAANGPIVILNASKLRKACDVLIMRSSSHPIHISLPQFTSENAQELSARVRTLSGGSVARSRGERHAFRLHPGGGDPDKVFESILATLWRSVVQPILRSLNLKKSKFPSRLWWLPTGPFASLPIHAAGLYGVDEIECECVSDYAISSYTPTLSALLSPPPLPDNIFKMLVAIQPVTKGQASLPYTTEELKKIEKHVPTNHLVKFGIPGAPAFGKDILLNLPTASIVHFACHGIQDVKNALDSALLLEDQPLKVSQLMQLDMPKVSLVFLSACQTAMVDERLPDEPIHLATTLLFTGFRGAVATTWSIMDRDGPTIADSFYRYLFSELATGPSHLSPDTTQAAYALHLAVTKLRNELHTEKAPSRFLRWVPFVHFGL